MLGYSIAPAKDRGRIQEERFIIDLSFNLPSFIHAIVLFIVDKEIHHVDDRKDKIQLAPSRIPFAGRKIHASNHPQFLDLEPDIDSVKNTGQERALWSGKRE